MKQKLLNEKWINWELWPFWLKYAPIMPVWIWYCLRAKSLWFFTPSNPTITFGGFEGEGKKEMYELLPVHTYPKTVFIQPQLTFEHVVQLASQNNFQYPFIVKPDVGMKGLLFRKIDNEEELKTYHRQISIEYMLQDLVSYPLEVSVFYYRHPAKPTGVITGFIQKDLMEVMGDGRKTLLELMQAHPLAKHRLLEMQTKYQEHVQTIIPANERFVLTYAANLSRGAKFTNLNQLIDDQLLAVFDGLSKPAQFYYGRYDIKCNSIEDLKSGKNFSILEYNGSGAEPNHVYHSGYTWFAALREFLKHWKVLYQISAYNNAQGIKYWPYKKGLLFLRQAKQHLALLEKLDNDIPV